MTKHLSQHMNLGVGASLIVLTLALFVIIACDTQTQSSAAIQANVVTVTSSSAIPTVAAAATTTELAFRAQVLGESSQSVADDERNPTLQALDDAAANNYAAMLTASALTPPPTIPPEPPTPAPTLTWELGALECASADAHSYVPASCWRVVIGGEMYSIVAGQESRERDPNQGVLMVFPGPLFYIPPPYSMQSDVYNTPAKVGSIYISSIDGERITLKTLRSDAVPDTFVFDLSTHQWVSP